MFALILTLVSHHPSARTEVAYLQIILGNIGDRRPVNTSAEA